MEPVWAVPTVCSVYAAGPARADDERAGDHRGAPAAAELGDGQQQEGAGQAEGEDGHPQPGLPVGPGQQDERPEAAAAVAASEA